VSLFQKTVLGNNKVDVRKFSRSDLIYKQLRCRIYSLLPKCMCSAGHKVTLIYARVLTHYDMYKDY